MSVGFEGDRGLRFADGPDGHVVIVQAERGDPERHARQCAHVWERRTSGRRYVNARGRCSRFTAHPSGYCKAHRWTTRWSEQDEARRVTR